jgi:hypothetical protein
VSGKEEHLGPRTGRDKLRVSGFASAALRATSVLLCGALIAACSGTSSAGRSSSIVQRRPAGPTARVAPLTGGSGVFLAEPITVNLKRFGYVQHEYTAAGTAASYQPNGQLGFSGRWSFVQDGHAPYRTRVLVRYPSDPARFSGTVVIEWLNVSGGVDADPEWASLYQEILRQGDAWVGVSTQQIGVMGGPVLVKVPGPGSQVVGKGLRGIDPKRYGSLHLPGDGFSSDIFTQVARAIRAGAGMSGLRPQRLIAAGESQSAFALVTYYDGVQPLTHEFDGFFVHSRGASGLPLVGPGQNAGIANALSGAPAVFRTDQDAPVIDVQAESDLTGLLNSYAARQPDNDRFRLWEVTGTSHADAHLLGANAKYIDCSVPINNGPMHLVAKAALGALTTWIDTGKAPVQAPRIDLTPGATPQVARDSDGIALGGIRTPPVDVPVAALSGVPGSKSSVICLLLGSTKPFTAARLVQLYPSRAAYLKRYDADADATITAGFVLLQDRAALLGFADPSVIPG